MMKKIIITLFVFLTQTFSQTNVELLDHFNPYPSIGYNDIWGYVDPQGNEYALLGTKHGTSIINVTDPSSPVEAAFIPGPQSIWRDIKVHGHFMYVVTEGTSTGAGLQIVDLSQLPNSATLVNTLTTWFNRAHNIYIDNGYAYVIGTNGGGGMHILDLSDPVNPVRTAYYSASNYIHDVYVFDDTVVAAAEDSYDLVDVSDKFNPSLISTSVQLPGIYAHSGWMTQDKRYFIGTEEFNSIDITVWDLQDRSSWDLVVPSWQTPSSATVHNLFIKGNYAHISYYSDGYVVLDISDPTTPYLAGQYDTEDAWGCYPFLPSGITLISDIQTGLYILQFQADDVPPSITHTPLTNIFNGDDILIEANVTDNNSVTDVNLHYRTIINSVVSDWNIVTDNDGPEGSLYQFIIPGQTNLSQVEYYLAAVDNNQGVTTLPSGGSGINPLGGTPPSTLFSLFVQIPGLPILNSFSPSGDTTVAPNSFVPFAVNAEDTSLFQLSYNWYKNGEHQFSTSENYIFNSGTSLPVPRTDSVRVIISNSFFSIEKTWNVTVDNPSGLNEEKTITEFKLVQNYPNPFNPSTIINFSLPDREFTRLTIYTSLGEKIVELVNEVRESGNYQVTFNVENLPSGLYIARIEAGSFSKSIKMNLIK